jgi:hypothetical protein
MVVVDDAFDPVLFPMHFANDFAGNAIFSRRLRVSAVHFPLSFNIHHPKLPSQQLPQRAMTIVTMAIRLAPRNLLPRTVVTHVPAIGSPQKHHAAHRRNLIQALSTTFPHKIQPTPETR